MNLLRDAFKKETMSVPDSPNSTGSNEVVKPNDIRVVGRIIKLSADGGWGFISSKDIKFTRIFFHWTSLRQDTLKFPELKIGMHVEFTPGEAADKGVRALKIKVVNHESNKG